MSKKLSPIIAAMFLVGIVVSLCVAFAPSLPLIVAVFPIFAACSIFNKTKELIFDNCPTPFDFTESGTISIEEVDEWVKVMEKINKVEE